MQFVLPMKWSQRPGDDDVDDDDDGDGDGDDDVYDDDDDDDDKVIVKTVVALLARELPERDVSHPWKEFLSIFSSFHLSLGGIYRHLISFWGHWAATWQVCLLHVDPFGRVVTNALEKRVCV